jgi:hypothetical protein
MPIASSSLRSRYDGNFIVHERNPSETFATDISRGKYEETLVMNSEFYPWLVAGRRPASVLSAPEGKRT